MTSAEIMAVFRAQHKPAWTERGGGQVAVAYASGVADCRLLSGGKLPQISSQIADGDQAANRKLIREQVDAIIAELQAS